jgi:hypothetical protein
VLSAVIRRPVGALLVGVGLLAAPVAAAPLKAVAEYTVTMGGTQMANVEVTLDDDGSSYSLNGSAKITGLARLVASGTAKLQSSGASTNAGLRSQRFNLLTRASGEDFTVAITYAAGNVDTFRVDPPIVNNIDRVAIERKQLVGNINDMAAAFVLKGGQLDAGLCDRQMQIFTGVERFNLRLSYAKDDQATSKRTGYQGPVVLCNVRYTPVSGHYTSSEVTQDLASKERILIWYAPLATPGYFIPYRALVTTESGDLSVVLTSLTQ